MIDRGANDRQPDREVHAATERHGFERDQPLIVIHGNHHVIRSANRGAEQGIGRKGERRVNPGAPGKTNGRCNAVLLFVAEQPVFARVRIESRHADTRLQDLEIVFHGAMSESNGLKHALGRQGVGNVPEGQVRRHKQNFQWPAH